MLELILLGLLGAGALLGGNKKESSSSGTKRFGTSGAKPFALLPASGSASQPLAEWRARWEPTVDKNQWIPSGTAERILAEHPAPASYRPWMSSAGRSKDLVELLVAEFATDNEAFLACQKIALKEFFETVEKDALTEEQIKACVCMDHRIQIVAAAGSGKTSTMVAKAGYVLQQGLALGSQILLLAFNTDAAEELAERAKDRLSQLPGAADITAKTFHSFGLHVIAKATGKKPSLAPWLEHPGEDIKMIVSIIDDLCKRDQTFRTDWHLFRTVYGRDVGDWNVPAEPDAYGDGRRGFRTANGEIVKSKEERMIADWLFYNQVPYEYERRYEHETATETHRQYYPDFYYPGADLYHEHFALDQAGRSPEHFGRSYLDGVRWKRELHQARGTKLFETTSAQISQGTALPLLEAQLTKAGISAIFDPEREATGMQPVTAQELAGTIRVFQQHVKSNGINHADLQAALKAHSKNTNIDRLKRFVSIYERVAASWEHKLKDGGYIDFEDMLNLAAEHVESGQYRTPFTTILSDEFQDSSRARIRLLKALAGQPEAGRHLCVVGDDWQGINRFAGADISVMREFDRIFPRATQLTLNTTFRSPQPICDVSSRFVQANPTQIRKEVASANHYESKQYIFAYAFEDARRSTEHLAEQLAQMQHYLKLGKLEPGKNGRLSVLLLGRYRSDRPADLRRWKAQFSEHLNLDFKTVHSSKGLEADYVMLLNVVEGNRGFPSQIEDDPVLQIPMPAPDPFPMAEERRLFYVALTRARRQVRIYTSLAQPSRFLVELAKQGAVEIEPIDAAPIEPCPKCSVGVITRRSGRNGEFESCSTWPRCDFKRNIVSTQEARDVGPIRLTGKVEHGSTCPSCDRGQMVRIEGKYGGFLGCSEFPVCKTTAQIS